MGNKRIATVTVLGFLAVGAFAQPVHEQATCDQWIASASNRTGGSEHCGQWVRDGYVSIQVNVDKRGCNIVGDAANEPSIAVDPENPRRVAIGWRQFDSVESSFRQAGYAYTRDAGRSWMFPGTLDPGVFGSDPVLAVGPGGVFYYSTFAIVRVRLFQSYDSGITWPLGVDVSDAFADKPWLTVDTTTSVGQGNVYIAGNGHFFRSTDGGKNFTHHGGVGYWPTMSVGFDGTLYVLNAMTFATLQISENAANPMEEPVFAPEQDLPLGQIPGLGDTPNPGGLLAQAWVATHHSPAESHENVYALATVAAGNGLDVRFVRSENGGVSWSDPVRVDDDAPGSPFYQWFAMMSVAPNGRIDAAWNDTRNTGDLKVSELYYSYSSDGGRTWAVNVPVSQPFNTWVGWPGDNKIGDYYHMVSDNLGANIAYAATFNNEQDIYFLRIGPYDCNGNESPDEDDIADQTSLDCNGNDVPDECEYRCDYDGNGLTTPADHANYVTCQKATEPPVTGCCALFDLEPDGDIDLGDFAFLQRAFNSE